MKQVKTLKILNIKHEVLHMKQKAPKTVKQINLDPFYLYFIAYIYNNCYT